MDVQRLTMAKFYELSGGDWRIDKPQRNNSDNYTVGEGNFYSKYYEADVNHDGLTYDEYLNYLEKLPRSYATHYVPTSSEKALAKLKLASDPEPIFFDNGQLWHADLNGNQVVMGIPCKGGTRVWFSREVSEQPIRLLIGTLSSDFPIPIIAGGSVKLVGQEGTEFHKYISDNLRKLVLSTEKTQHLNWVCTAGEYSGKEIKISCDPGSEVDLFDNGNPIKFYHKGELVGVDSDGNFTY